MQRYIIGILAGIGLVTMCIRLLYILITYVVHYRRQNYVNYEDSSIGILHHYWVGPVGLEILKAEGDKAVQVIKDMDLVINQDDGLAITVYKTKYTLVILTLSKFWKGKL